MELCLSEENAALRDEGRDFALLPPSTNRAAFKPQVKTCFFTSM